MNRYIKGFAIKEEEVDVDLSAIKNQKSVPVDC